MKWLKICRETGDMRNPVPPERKKVTVTDGPFAETKELVLHGDAATKNPD